MAEVHLERNEQEIARELLEGVGADAERSHRLTVQADVALQQAKLARSLGDVADAEALLTQSRLGYPEPDAGVLQVFGEEAVAQALQFDPARASSLIVELDPDRIATRLLTARAALHEHDDRQAAGILSELPPATTRRARGRAGRVVCSQRARARRRRGQPTSRGGARRRAAASG